MLQYGLVIPNVPAKRGLYRLAAILVLLLAWALLLWRLNDVPPGLQHDETFNAVDAVDLLYGHLKLYFPANFGREPLFFYTIAAAFRLAGGHFVWSLRYASAAWALAGCAATITLGRRYLPRSAALVAAAAVAGSFWFLFIGRVGLRAVTLLPLSALTFYLASRGLARRSPRDLALAGVVGGLAIYTYLAARVLLALPVLLLLRELVALVIRSIRRQPPGPGDSVAGAHEQAAKPIVSGLLACLLLMALVAAPLLLYLRAHPASADLRVAELNAPLNAALRGQPAALLRIAAQGVGSLLWFNPEGPAYQYNLPGRPALALPWAICFLVGLGALLLSLGRRASFALLAALALALLPDLLAPGGPLYLRAIMALPLLYIVAVRGLWIVGRAVQASTAGLIRARQARRALAAAAILFLLAAHVYEGGSAYFGAWAGAPVTQQIYNGNLRSAAALLAGRPAGEQVFLGSDYWLDLDQQTYQFYEPRRFDVGWFNAAHGLPLPAPEGALYVVTPSSSRFPGAVARLIATGEPALAPAPESSGASGLAAFRLSPEAITRTLGAFLAALPAPVRFGDALELTAAGVEYGGGTVGVVTRWNAAGSWQDSAPPKLSAALVDSGGYVWAQTVDAPALAPNLWRAGTGFLQIGDLEIPADLPPGDYGMRAAVSTDGGGPLPIRRSGVYLAAAPVVANLHLPAAASDPVASRAAPPGGSPASASPAPKPPRPPLSVLSGGPLAVLGSWEALPALQAGVPITIHVSWRADAPLATADLHFRVRGLAANDTVLWQQEADPPSPLPANWPAGQVYRLSHRLQPAAPADGVFAARLELCALQGGEPSGCAVIAEPQVARRSLLLAPPAQPQHALSARYGDMLALAGYDVVQGEDHLDLTLYWRVDAAPSAPLKRFVHAVGPGDRMLGQADGTPDNGGTPMPYWQPGEYVVDQVQVPLPPGARPTLLWVGWYHPDTGQRLVARASPEGEPLPDNRLGIPLP